MSSVTTLSLDRLPLEVLHIVFCYIDIPDILRMRRVSQYLNKATYHRKVWVDAYRTAQFVRPPGPFPSQSMRELEKALETSWRVHQNICDSGGATDTEGSNLNLNVREIRYAGPLRHPRVKLVFGRFLLVACREEVYCYDLDLDKSSGARIVYRTTDGGVLRAFHRVSAIDDKGCTFTCVVLSEATKTVTRTSIFSPNVRQQSELTLDVIHQFEFDAFQVKWVDLGPRVIIIRGITGHSLDGECLVTLDVHTRTQFLFDTSPPAWGSTKLSLGTVRCISTSTHVVLAQTAYTRATGCSTFFQAFALPSPGLCRSTATPISLSPSHHGIIPEISPNVCGALLLHDAVLDPSTQDVLIAIRVFESPRTGAPRTGGPLSRHGTLRLSSIHNSSDSEVGSISFEVHGPLSAQGNVLVFHPSFNGIGRVFYTFKNVLWALEYDLLPRVNRDGEQESRAIADYPILRLIDTHHALFDYDPWSGRVCLESTAGDDTVISIWDFSV